MYVCLRRCTVRARTENVEDRKLVVGTPLGGESGHEQTNEHFVFGEHWLRETFFAHGSKGTERMGNE